MHISYNWLKELIETQLSPHELAQGLTSAGLAVEGIEEVNGDPVFDIDLTSNRPDCLSHLGIAREICAFDQNSRLKSTHLADPEPKIQNPESPEFTTILDPDLCHRFTARIIRSLKIGPSPDWLVERLKALGERTINNVADITNYVMLELGQPMHAFDLNKLAGNRIVVRRARVGESITTLDEIKRNLDDSMLAICDIEKPVAIAGVMGGFESGISNDTRDVLLEVAYFKASSIRHTSRKLNLSTEASYRFERGVDIENLIRASNRATDLICELAGGQAGEFIDVYRTQVTAVEIESKDIQAATKRLTGLDVNGSEIDRILKALGIAAKDISHLPNSKSQIFMPPSWRHDLTIEEDLVEEVARIIGYDEIEAVIPPTSNAGAYQPNETRKLHLRQKLADLGFDEALSYSFIDTKYDHLFEPIPDFVLENLVEKFVTIKDPIIDGSTRMRSGLLSGLLNAVRSNLNHQRRDIRLFELGKVFSASEDGLPNERELLSIVLTGHEIFEDQALEIRAFDFYDLKGAVENVFDALNLPIPEFKSRDVLHLRKGQSAEVFLGNQPLGTLGRLSESLAAQFKFKQPVYVAELDLERILESKEERVLYNPLPVYPSIVRDVSVMINRHNSFSEILDEITGHKYDLLQNVYYVDVFEGQGVANDQRSLTIRLEYRSNQRTLLEEEIEPIHTRILANLELKLGIKQKS